MIQSRHLPSAELILLVVTARIVLSLYPQKKKLPFAHCAFMCISFGPPLLHTRVYTSITFIRRTGGAWESFKQTNVFFRRKKNDFAIRKISKRKLVCGVSYLSYLTSLRRVLRLLLRRSIVFVLTGSCRVVKACKPQGYRIPTPSPTHCLVSRSPKQKT